MLALAAARFAAEAYRDDVIDPARVAQVLGVHHIAALGLSFAVARTIAGECLVVFRGTDDLRDWFVNLDADPYEPLPTGHRRVHSGFWRAWQVARSYVGFEISRGNFSRVVFAGHSLGAALAFVGAWQTALNNSALHVAACGIGCPRVGNREFVTDLESRVAELSAFCRVSDVVTYAPPLIMGYRHPERITRLRPLPKLRQHRADDYADSIEKISQ